MQGLHRRQRGRRGVRRRRSHAGGRDVGQLIEVVVRTHGEPDRVSVGRRRMAADAGVVRGARLHLTGDQHGLHRFIADAEPLEGSDLRPHVVGQRPVDDLPGRLDRRDHEAGGRGGRRGELDGPPRPDGERAHRHGNRSAVDRVAQAVPGCGVERVGRVGGEDAEGMGEPAHREIDLEEVLAAGGCELEARPQPVARHQRPGDGRGDARGAVAALAAAVEQRGCVRRRRRVDDRRGREVGERRCGRAGGAAGASGRARSALPGCAAEPGRASCTGPTGAGSLRSRAGSSGEPAPDDSHQDESDDRRGDRQPGVSSHVESHVGSTVAACRQTYAVSR